MSAPEAIRQLAALRAEARASKDFSQADQLRSEIDAAGWRVVDTADGFELVEKPPFDVYPSLAEADCEAIAPLVVTLIVDGWPDDVDTCLQALTSHAPVDSAVLVFDCGNVDHAGERAEAWAHSHPDRVRVVHLEQTLQQMGWAAIVTKAVELANCSAFVVMDLSTVLEGDAFTPMLEILNDESIVATGWRGVNVNVDDAWRSFDSSGPGEVDAVLGYLMMVRRDRALQVPPNPKARFYRNADMEWSLLLREAGGRIVIPEGELPVRQDRHHGYHDSDPAYRDKQSKKTYDRILQRFRGRDELLAPR